MRVKRSRELLSLVYEEENAPKSPCPPVSLSKGDEKQKSKECLTAIVFLMLLLWIFFEEETPKPSLFFSL